MRGPRAWVSAARGSADQKVLGTRRCDERAPFRVGAVIIHVQTLRHCVEKRSKELVLAGGEELLPPPNLELAHS